MQKTAYEVRISDWSSDVCSSDLSSQSPLPLPSARCCPDSTVRTAAIPRRTKPIDTDGFLGEERSARRRSSRRRNQCPTTALRNRERSEERREGKGCVSTCSTRLSPYH